MSVGSNTVLRKDDLRAATVNRREGRGEGRRWRPAPYSAKRAICGFSPPRTVESMIFWSGHSSDEGERHKGGPIASSRSVNGKWQNGCQDARGFAPRSLADRHGRSLL